MRFYVIVTIFGFLKMMRNDAGFGDPRQLNGSLISSRILTFKTPQLFFITASFYQHYFLGNSVVLCGFLFVDILSYPKFSHSFAWGLRKSLSKSKSQ